MRFTQSYFADCVQEFASILGSQQRVASLKTPTALYGVVVPAGGELVPLFDEDELPHAITLTMAAVDVSEAEESTKACSIKVIRRPIISDEDDDEDVDEEEIAMYTDEFVLCTLKPGVIYQQPLQVAFSEGEAIYFLNTGDCDVHLTGNYMTPVDEPNGQEYDSDEDDYDSEEDDSLIDDMAEEASEADDIDEIDRRITELEEADKAAKPSKKRRISGEADLDAVMDNAAGEAETKAEQKLSKKERKKLKGANGEAKAAPVSEEIKAPEESGKRSVSFSNDTKTATKTLAGGVVVEDRKDGEGPSCKNGSRVSIRYVGKLKSNSKVFDQNTKGKPFAFKLGSGECIKGMETGVLGMKAGGERRVTIPSAQAYGSQKLPEIPANSDLVFDIKLLKFT